LKGDVLSFALSFLILMTSPVTGEGALAPKPQSHGIVVTGTPNRISQLRIQRRIIIRVPRQNLVPMTALTDVTPQPALPRFKEKKIGKCAGYEPNYGRQADCCKT